MLHCNEIYDIIIQSKKMKDLKCKILTKQLKHKQKRKKS